MKNENYELLPPFMRIKLAVDAADLLGLLAIGAPPDEYDVETKAILAKIDQLDSPLACIETVCEVFTHFFGMPFLPNIGKHQKLGHVIWSRLQIDEGWVSQLLSLAQRFEARIVGALAAAPLEKRKEMGLDQEGLTSGAAEVADLIKNNELGLAVEHLLYMAETAIDVHPHEKQFLDVTMKRLSAG